MTRNDIDNIIVALIVIKEFSKDIHYTSHGEAFYAKHLLADKFNFDEAIDLLKECCLLGNGDRPLISAEYLQKAINQLPVPEEKNDKKNFEILDDYLYKTLNAIDEIQDLSKADENVIGGIAQDLQQYKGLVNLQVE